MRDPDTDSRADTGPSDDTPGDCPRPDGRLLRGEATRERVLDAAERLFSAEGVDAVSIRQIAAAAGVTLGVVGFHGGSKTELIRTVLSRRVEALNIARRDRLARVMAGPAPKLDDLVEAYILPYLEYASHDDPQWGAYARLIARIVADDRWYKNVGELYDPMAREYLDAMQQVCPEADRDALVTALTLTVASMLSLVASRARIAGLTGHAGGNAMDHRDTLVSFCVNGMTAIASRKGGPQDGP
ncbi:TetR family transcriptional regulator [Pseudooceanicola sp. 216_PA32_1]|uniref:TetR family transcriptional regulator n=1 Tax=Pseudooceanicola pacificus TaxID=2676438 RepID=A0A844W142_9RHOB|nr:TetR/AcrR family transcriptional regulator [Pseudooceanicola pacificus]MWB76531.1 TetR family transcriptional regulator [Pseudooceanicola pacificus]